MATGGERVNIGVCIHLTEVSTECRFSFTVNVGKKFCNSVIEGVWGPLNTGFTVQHRWCQNVVKTKKWHKSHYASITGVTVTEHHTTMWNLSALYSNETKLMLMASLFLIIYWMSVLRVVSRFLRFHPKSRRLFPFYFSNITLRTDLLTFRVTGAVFKMAGEMRWLLAYFDNPAILQQIIHVSSKNPLKYKDNLTY